MRVFVIILNFNGQENSLECLESIMKLETRNWKLEVVVVDNGSTDGSVKAVKEQFPKVIVLENKENLGFAEGNNVGIKYALKNNAGFVFLLNNDTLIDKRALVQLIKQATSNIQSGILAPKIYFAPGFEFHQERYKEDERGRVIWYAGGIMDWKNVIGRHRGVDEVDHGQYEKIEETDFVSGCAMLVKKEVFEKIGLLDKDYFLYYEDNDFCQRAKKSGFKIFFVPKAIVWHKNAGSSRVGSSLHDYYITRNRLLFGLRWAPLRTKLALLRESLRVLVTGRPWQRRGIIDFYLGRFEKGSYEA